MATPEPKAKIDSNFVINKILNLTSNYDVATGVDQVPFFLSILGVPTMRNKTEAYKVEK